ncbi:hypothetical protein [Streptomyces sp. NPDC059894]
MFRAIPDDDSYAVQGADMSVEGGPFPGRALRGIGLTAVRHALRG